MNDKVNLKIAHEGTILVVDDLPDNLNVLLDFLSKEGFKVLVAKGGNAALKKAAYAHPDLILLDVMMPDLSGFKVCEILKSQANTQDIPIIFMTARSDTVDKLKGFELDAVDYITKPVQHEEVKARVRTHIKLRKLQQQLEEEVNLRKKYAELLEKRNMELKAFARTVAHDLKNPLNGIIGVSDLLLAKCAGETDEISKEYLQWIAESGEKMVEIIDALLLLAGASQQSSVETQALEMSLLINQVVEKRLAHMIRDFQGEIRFPDSDSWPVAMGYEPWVEEIWANYLSNGLKYGGEPPFLELGANTLDDGKIRFWVRDNGPGLTKEAQAKLFKPFTRLHRNRADGHGLGLSIVQQVVEKLGGQAGVESVVGEGSLFYFTLPAKSAKRIESLV